MCVHVIIDVAVNVAVVADVVVDVAVDMDADMYVMFGVVVDVVADVVVVEVIVDVGEVAVGAGFDGVVDDVLKLLLLFLFVDGALGAGDDVLVAAIFVDGVAVYIVVERLVVDFAFRSLHKRRVL